MAYHNQGQYTNQSAHYRDGNVETPADGYSAGYPQNGQHTHWANGTGHEAYVPVSPPGQVPPAGYTSAAPQPRISSHSGYGYTDQIQAQSDSRRPSTYNPRQYAQQVLPLPQYNPQAYAPPNHPYPGQAAYQPATYVDQYGHSQPGVVQQSQSYASPTYASPTMSTQSGSYGHSSPTPSQQFYTPPVGYSQHGGFSQHHTSSADQSRMQTYSTYSQPAPQMASTYPVSPQPAYTHQDYQPHQLPVSPPVAPYPSISPALPGLHNERSLPSPPVYSTSTGSLPTYDPRAERNVSPLYSPASQISGPGPTPPAHGPHRTDTFSRHPQSRPLPGPPEPDNGADYFRGDPYSGHADEYDDELQAQDELYSQVENALLGSSPQIGGDSPRVPLNTRPPPLFGSHSRSMQNGVGANGHASSGINMPYMAGESDEDDAEALAGLEAMRAAEAEDAAQERRRQSGSSSFLGGYGSQRQSRVSTTDQTQDRTGYESDDYATVDMGLYGGGYEAHMSYGGDPSELAIAADTMPGAPRSQPASSAGSLHRLHDRGGSYDYGAESAFNTAARVDAGGTGGLAEPRALGRRQSYDEGDEFAFTEDTLIPGEPPDLFYHPTVSPYRPLPPPPASPDVSLPPLETSISQEPPYPLAPDAYVPSTTNPGTWVLRSTSLVSQSNTPSVIQPIRAKTDAEDRLRKQGYRASVYSTFDPTPSTSAVAIDLPSLPTKRFNPAKLGAADFKKCEEPWALSQIWRWLRNVADPEHMTELKESIIKDALVALFTNKVPTMNIADAEVLSNRVVEEMFAAGTLKTTEEWVRLSPGSMSGVIFQLTRSGCYSPTLHDHINPGRCYSHHCQRTLKKVNLQSTGPRPAQAWHEFYKLTKEDLDGADKKEVERQNILHEIVETEDGYMEQLNVLRTLYRDPLQNADPAVINTKRLGSFVKEVFGKVDAVKKANEDHLLPQLKYRQIEQGPWIVGFSDIFRQWIRKAKTAYIEYAAGFPGATLMVRQELERNLEFRAFVEKARSQKASGKLGWDTYLKAPITRLQRYSLLLFTVHKNMKDDSEEKANLQIAIDEVKAVTLECDSRVAEMQRKVDLADLGQKLILRPGMQQDVELNLNHLGRELIFRGDLQRTGQNRFNWLECHALLFDHYMILAKGIFVLQKGTGAKVEKYDVSRLPIPMDLLVLESMDDDAVMKSSYVRGITSVTTVPGSRGQATSSPAPSRGSDPNRLGRTLTAGSPAPGPFDRTNTSTSINSTSSAPPTIVNSTVTEASKDSDKIVYPFRIRHLGREPYVLFAPSAANRAEWATRIIEAKTRHAKSLYAQHAEPFRLRVIADSAFYYDYSGGGTTNGKRIVIQGTPMDRAIKEVERKFKDAGRPGPVCRAKVNCATSFTTPYPGKHMVAIGTDYGVYACEIDNPRGWTKAINIPRVTQVAVLEEFNLFLLISAGALIAYHLDAVCSSDRPSTNSAADSSARKAPQKLSGSRDVGFFGVGRMKERTLVFYKKRDGLSSTFKVLEPVFQKSTEKKRGIFKRGTTEFFRDYDEFYIPAECSGINLFQSSLAVSTSRGFEVLTLDKKQPFSVPDLKAPEVANIATHIESQQTLGMLRLSEQEFLLCYEKCAVYVNKHGDVSRSVIMNFVGRARSAALYGAYLVLFDTDFVEIRNAQNGRLKQIIAGKEVKCLDDGGGGTISGGSINAGVVNGVPALGAGGRTVKMVMQHPEAERTQIVVELVLNEGLKESS